MNDPLIGLGVFLLGASSGALLKYLQDRHLLRTYADLVRRLSEALQEQIQMPQAHEDTKVRKLQAEAETLRKKHAS